LAAIARRKLGGQTGDVLGAGQQLAEIAGYVTWVAVLAV
jgi:adenosylcobinamide-GDP ribazoletransferase